MKIEMIADYDLELENLISETEKLEFPFFTGEKRKIEFMLEEKSRIDSKIDCIVEKYQVSADKLKAEREKIWNNAIQISEKKFYTLPSSLKMNSFFLQEVMHEYAESQAKCVKQTVREKSM